MGLKRDIPSPHDILESWQAGEIGYREAIRLTASEDLFELYQACRSSGVEIRKEFSTEEIEKAKAAAADILGDTR